MHAASVAGTAVSATTDSGTSVKAFSGTGTAVSATAGGTSPAVLATNVSGGEAVKIAGDAASTTAVLAPLMFVPLQNQPSGAHAIGHMYVTAAGKLMICTSAGTPGTWTIVGTQS